MTEKLSTTEKRNDLKLASNALLLFMSKSKSKNWVPIWDFISMSEEEKEEIIKAKEEENKELLKKRQKPKDKRNWSWRRKTNEISQRRKRKKLLAAASFEL